MGTRKPVSLRSVRKAAQNALETIDHNADVMNRQVVPAITAAAKCIQEHDDRLGALERVAQARFPGRLLWLLTGRVPAAGDAPAPTPAVSIRSVD